MDRAYFDWSLVHTWNIYLCQKVQEQRARVLALLEEKEEENQKVQDENQKAKIERERILELLENLISLQKKWILPLIVLSVR